MSGLVQVVAPAAYPVTLAEAKAHLRVEHDEKDDLIELYIAGETATAERFMGRSLVPQTWDYVFDAFPAATAQQVVELPMPKVIEVLGVFYNDTAGTEQELDPASYVLDLASQPARIGLPVGGTWPTIYDGIGAVRVRFTAGYLNADSPPAAEVLADIKVAILLRVQATFEGGERADALREAAEIYLRRRKIHLSLA